MAARASESRAAEGAHPQTLRQKDRPRRGHIPRTLESGNGTHEASCPPKGRAMDPQAHARESAQSLRYRGQRGHASQPHREVDALSTLHPAASKAALRRRERAAWPFLLREPRPR
ncbi:hypothetical protein BURKHO8Y_240077 [Burkholderia sp. 8Y]|nr:hypothetical protein BURKHO8Y_240077 [Burkholderia sp. 8Y]